MNKPGTPSETLPLSDRTSVVLKGMDFSLFEKPDEARRILIEIMRFMNQKVAPAIEEFLLLMPAKNDLANRGMRTAEDGRYIFHMSGQALQFRERVLGAVTAFVEPFTDIMEATDNDMITDLYQAHLDKLLHPVNETEQLLGEMQAKIVDDPFKEEVGSVEAAVEEARLNAHVTLDELFRG